LQKIAAAFREAIVEVATTTRLPICETNLVCIETFYKEDNKDSLK
ncbi:22624_t:CDS:1, partial [Racocetra persica]